MGGMLRRRHRPKALLGIDISATHIRLLELDGTGGTFRAAGYACEPLPAYAVSNDQILDVDAVGKAIDQARKKSGARSTNTAIAVPSSAVISKTITLPAALHADEIEQQLLLEAPRHIPYPIEDISLDFQVLGVDPADNAQNQVLLVACRRDNIEIRIAALEIAGLSPRWVDVEEYAVRNACSLLHKTDPDRNSGQAIAIFDIGSQKTRLNVQRDQQTTYSHERPSILTEPPEPAGRTELAANADGEQTTDSATGGQLDDFCHQLAKEIEEALQLRAAADTTSHPIDQILLTGVRPRHPGFEARMHQRLRYPVACADPLAHIQVGARARHNHIRRDSAALMVAIGLSMRAWQ